MAERRPGPGRVRGAFLSGLLLVVAGCAEEPVSVSTPDVGPSVRAACERFLADVPAELAGEPERELADDSALGAAWGDPAIVLTCGVDLPADFDRFAECIEANGVGWFVPEEAGADQSATAVVTAAGYRPVVQASVPGDYRPEGIASVMAELAAPVEEHLELVEPCE